MSITAVQDQYPEDFAQCYGCGRLNEKGLKIRSVRNGDIWLCRFTPSPEHRAMKGIVYGGLVASLIDCHATGTAAGAATLHAGDEITADTVRRFVTARIEVNFLAPTPLGVELELRATTPEVRENKVVVDVELLADDTVTAKGHVICVQAPASLFD